MLENIPSELKVLNQWVCANENKIPIDPKNGKVASPTNPETWGTYEQALAFNSLHKGFVFTHNDPYCIIDLDDKPDAPATDDQRKRFENIINNFKTYTEISQSGFGVHVICKASIPKGCRKDKVEIYSNERYVILTGNVIGQVSTIEDRQDMISAMYGQIAVNRSLESLVELHPLMTDTDVLKMAEGAQNGSGDKFKALWRGEFSGESQSEADFALLSLLAFYSRSNEQVTRLFRKSVLGQRDKAQRDDYINRSLEKIRPTLEKPKVDFSQLTFPAKEAHDLELGELIKWPPGLVGEIAKYVYATSNRPVREISIGAAIALVSGVAARAYNISRTGLNQYIIIIAKTGRGKEECRKGVDRIFSQVRKETKILNSDNSIIDSFIGPEAFASGQGLVKHLSKYPSTFSVLGEFGKTLQEMTNNRVSPALESLKKNLLNLYNKSGANDYLKGTVYSNDDNDVKGVRSPNLTILGEGATGSFYDNLDSAHIEDGLIPRFLVLEYKGKRVPSNYNISSEFPQDLIERVILLFHTAVSASHSETAYNIPINEEADKMLKSFDAWCDDLINESGNTVESELWSRAHLKALKLAGTLAVGLDQYNPVVDVECAEYALYLVKRTTRDVLAKFSSGEVGNGDHRQENDLRKAIETYEELTPAKRRTCYKVAVPLSQYNNVVSYSFLKKYLRLRKSFKEDRRGAYGAIDLLIARLVKEGVLLEIPSDQALSEFETKSIIYTKGYNW